MLGLTFKEDVPDLRNSKVIDVIRGLEGWGHEVLVHDPHADRAEAKHEYGVDMIGDLDGLGAFDCVVAAVAHRAYAAFDTGRLATLTRPGGVIADVKGVWRSLEMPPDRVRWEL
jgi:UDP-N-acetyl-D-galactosamine dehydrogenase